MPVVCAKTLEESEFPWLIDPSRPHEKGEFQNLVERPCRCTPVEITWEEYERRKDAVYERLLRE